MGEEILINTTMVRKYAENINQINIQIRNDFKDVEEAVRRLDSSWNSRAGDAVIRNFHQWKDHYSHARYQAIQNIYRFMINQVSDGYHEAEKTNISLAEAFK